jgi:hypothetical protein
MINEMAAKTLYGQWLKHLCQLSHFGTYVEEKPCFNYIVIKIYFFKSVSGAAL